MMVLPPVLLLLELPPVLELSTSLTTTFCSLVLFRFPASFAFLRRPWMEFMTASGSLRNISPSSLTHSGFLLSISRTSGKATREATLGSQFLSCTALTASSPLSLGFSLDHFAASMTCSG